MQRQIHKAKSYGGQPVKKRAIERAELREEEDLKQRIEGLALYWVSEADQAPKKLVETTRAEDTWTCAEYGGEDKVAWLWSGLIDRLCEEVEEKINRADDLLTNVPEDGHKPDVFRATTMISRHVQIEQTQALMKRLMEEFELNMLVNSDGLPAITYTVDGRSRSTRPGWALNINITWRREKHVCVPGSSTGGLSEVGVQPEFERLS